MKIYVGNISRESTENEIRDAFAEFGEVTDITLIRDNYTKVLKGFGFIEMPNGDEANTAIMALNGREIKGRAIKVNEARPRELELEF